MQGKDTESRALRRLAALTALAAAVALSGCATTAADGSARDDGWTLSGGAKGAELAPRLSDFLEEAPTDDTIELGQSAWGAEVTLTAGAPYHAASGRRCRELTIQGTEEGVTEALACRTEAGWVRQRLVIREAVEDRE